MVPSKPPGLPRRSGGDTVVRVIVAVKAEKVISKSGLAWALTHAARPGDCITLLAIFSENRAGGRRFWGFPRLKGDCRSCDPSELPGRIRQISESCSQMVLQLHDQIQVRVRIKVVSVITAGAVAAETRSSSASWVILDKKLKGELKHCMDELNCNIVAMKGSHAKVLRLNLACPSAIQTPFYSAASSPIKDKETYNMKHTTPVSSPEDPNTSYTRTSGDNSLSSPDTGSSSYVVYEQNPLYDGLNKRKNPPSRQNTFDGVDYVLNASIREAVSLKKTSSISPPLCSLCQFEAPAFGKPPKQFQYTELEEATDGFSDTNFVAEGGFGLVHRGVLRNGLVISVKELGLVGPQRDADFCREVRVLSCAQHRNVVLLLGFCIEGKKRLLVYEYVCNSSLDFHLHGNGMPILDWGARLKIAIGTARGLRYLHEDCRVGCIIHRNLRPDNILLTHDFEPLVAEFGLARLDNEWKFYDKNQVVGASGYLAPEYYNDGKMTEKVDIYAYGLVLLELITGRRARDLQYCTEHQFLLDNIDALSAIEPIHILAYKHQLLDPRLASFEPQGGLPYELHAMGFAASLCLQQDPDLRPPMSKVVKMLEGVSTASLDLDSFGCRSGRIEGLNSNALESKRRHSRRLSY
ncbi:hypothetical protein ABFS82_03G052500 [Erythranthe guttata]|uniref:inactive protein kinase SELMODRAFT_444075-like n=1 Tax=Erythranthe guttata TaxID=4155 RepID=UPI00064DEDCD|nr:PREDICTED: inactive protein kinase SELMODRAFT_444075-like [Erythranthe guttata]|eukprot:XP_012845527.1 PREDICTED: inactive protein kinase SELMODRAFT_444075-like [Erythranthe guttata]